MSGKSDTLIVVAAYDESFKENIVSFQGGDILVASTSSGGHPSAAYINAYRSKFYKSYLFIQDSLVGHGDVVAPFAERDAPVVAWASFDLFFDDSSQAAWVASQYPPPYPRHGIFGPIFYATRKALRKLEDRGLFPQTPPNKLMAQGTERAWAIAFHKAGIPVEYLGPCITDGQSPRLFPEHPVFTKEFAGRT